MCESARKFPNNFDIRKHGHVDWTKTALAVVEILS